jgi:hypothetical protein
LQQLMTFFRVAGQQSGRGGDGRQQVSMPLNPVFKKDFAARGQNRTGKIEEEANFAPF